MSRDKSDELAHQYTRVYWLEQDNARLLAQISKVVRKMAPFREMASHAMVAIFPQYVFW